MKKAKLMLSALAILAVVGTAFAFKANRFAVHYVYTGAYVSGNATGACQTAANGTGISNGTAAVYASTASAASGCPYVYTVTITD